MSGRNRPRGGDGRHANLDFARDQWVFAVADVDDGAPADLDIAQRSLCLVPDNLGL